MSERIELIENGVCMGVIEFHVAVDFADIHDVVVKAEYRGKGYGAKLMSEFLTQMKKRNVIDVTLEVRMDNVAAIALYEKFGFKKVNVRKGYYGNVDGLLMKLASESR